MYTSKYWKSASTGDGVGSYYRERRGYIQPRPYVRPLPHRWTSHDIIQATATGVYLSGFGGMADASANRGDYLFSPYCFEYAGFDSLITQATNNVLDKFYNQLDEQAMLAVNYAERARSIDMMVARLSQLARFARAVRKFDLINAAKSLGLDPSSGVPRALVRGPRPSRWRSAKDRSKIVSNAWLEFHFGWEPLVKDIFNAIEVLESPTLEKTVEARSGVTMELRDFQNPYGESYLRETYGFVTAKTGATLLVTDYNAFAASRLGLTNPAAWAWELIPFSFVVDWFSTVGSFINQWSDLDGYTLIDPWYTTTTVANKCTYEKRYQDDILTIKSVGVLSRRLLTVPRYEIAWRPLKRLSMVRAATAIALLTQFLP